LRLAVIAVAAGVVASLGVLGVALSGASPGRAPQFPEVRRSADARATPRSGPSTPPVAAGAPSPATASTSASPSVSPSPTRRGHGPTAPPGRTKPSKGPKS
jgi:hypothetical protein